MLNLTRDQRERKCDEKDELKCIRDFLEHTLIFLERQLVSVYQNVNCKFPLAQDPTSSNLCYWYMQKAFCTRTLTHGAVCAGSSSICP